MSNGTGVNGAAVNGAGINGTGINGTGINGTGINGAPPPLGSSVPGLGQVFPIYQGLNLNKIEWLIISALVFIAVAAWTDLILMLIRKYTQQTDQDIQSQSIYALIITGLGIMAILYLRVYLKQ